MGICCSLATTVNGGSGEFSWREGRPIRIGGVVGVLGSLLDAVLLHPGLVFFCEFLEDC